MAEQHVSVFAELFSSFMAKHSGLSAGGQETVQKCCSALVMAMQEGNTCLGLSPSEQDIIEKSALVSSDGDNPLVLYNDSLYLSRYYRYEQQLARRLAELSKTSYEIEELEYYLDLLFSAQQTPEDQQRQAGTRALLSGLCVISGGPGTGKTTTIIKIAALLQYCHGAGYQIALAAPTGKAAKRLEESIAAQLPKLKGTDSLKDALPHEASTLHRLLGTRGNSHTFVHNRDNRLAWDAVIVDEASMVDLAMMSKLVESLGDDSRLILVGDKDQLASVESGAVLSECIAALPDNVVQLTTTYRFNPDISLLASAIRRGDSREARSLIESDGCASVRRCDPDWLMKAVDSYAPYFEAVRNFRAGNELSQLFSMLNGMRILCAVKHGLHGVSGITEQMEILLQRRYNTRRDWAWYPGKPIMITKNDYELGLYNGDVGICLSDPGEPHAEFVWFESEKGTSRRFPLSRLPIHETAWVLTVHKSQGSEFNEVTVVLPPLDTPILSAELLYTAITRARVGVQVFDPGSLFSAAVERKISRQSGLAAQLAADEHR